MYYAYPTISMYRANELLECWSDLSISELHDRSGVETADVEPAMAGTPVPRETLQKVAEQVRNLAVELGYPDEQIARGNVRLFDRPAGAVLHDLMQISPAEASRSEVWNYVSLIWLCDVAVWRFPSRETYRIMGAGYGPTANRRNRNAFGRLWWATEVLDSEARLSVADGSGEPLGEDEIVGIMERSNAIAPAPVVAQTLAKHGRMFFYENGERMTLSRQDFFRELGKYVTRLRAVVNISALGEEEVSDLMEEACRLLLVDFRVTGRHETG